MNRHIVSYIFTQNGDTKMGIALEAVRKMKKLVVEPPPLLSQLTALTPHDGRYAGKTFDLNNFCSEAGLQRFRTFVEIENLIYSNQKKICEEDQDRLKEIYWGFSVVDALRIKEIEQKINHDVKAVEYYIHEKLDFLNLSHLKPETHKFLTSEDVTNVAIGLIVHASRDVIVTEVEKLFSFLIGKAREWESMSMLARTHGQPASPTTVGKEFAIFANRIHKVKQSLESLPIEVKWNGATGNYNAHEAACPEVDWIEFSQDFIENHLGFTADLYTGQTSNYVYLANILHQMKNLSSILIDLSRDMWMYISYDNFKLKLKAGEVGSSVMPHKVNPINFENAEGNCELAEALFGVMASKLQKSRMQRDLSDSTVLRNLGLAFGWLLIGIKSAQAGLSKIDVNEDRLRAELESNPSVISEAIQSIMREHGIDGAYERLKEFTRGQDVSFEQLRGFIHTLKGELPDNIMVRLDALHPQTYTGRAEDLVEVFLREHL